MVSRRGAAGRTENKVDSRRETRMNMRALGSPLAVLGLPPLAVLVRPKEEIFSSLVYIRVYNASHKRKTALKFSILTQVQDTGRYTIMSD